MIKKFIFQRKTYSITFARAFRLLLRLLVLLSKLPQEIFALILTVEYIDNNNSSNELYARFTFEHFLFSISFCPRRRKP